VRNFESTSGGASTSSRNVTVKTERCSGGGGWLGVLRESMEHPALVIRTRASVNDRGRPCSVCIFPVDSESWGCWFAIVNWITADCYEACVFESKAHLKWSLT
jgi:hypothetical protein